VKKESEYKDRGVGMLYLKTSGESKTQLLVRTATTTGQILLNTLVTSDLRPARQGKNNVQIVCIPTPSDKSPAITLIRVKTSEDADELLAKINEYIR
jgi:nuclear pore complex protein Nup50